MAVGDEKWFAEKSAQMKKRLCLFAEEIEKLEMALPGGTVRDGYYYY